MSNRVLQLGKKENNKRLPRIYDDLFLTKESSCRIDFPSLLIGSFDGETDSKLYKYEFFSDKNYYDKITSPTSCNLTQLTRTYADSLSKLKKHIDFNYQRLCIPKAIEVISNQQNITNMQLKQSKAYT